MTERLEKRIATLERKNLPFEEVLEHDEQNWMLTSYSECDAQLRTLLNYKELKTKVDEAILVWYESWYESWRKASEEGKKKLLALIHCRIREEFMKVKETCKL